MTSAKMSATQLQTNEFSLPPKDGCFINQLPPELLVRVFRLCSAGDVKDSDLEDEQDEDGSENVGCTDEGSQHSESSEDDESENDPAEDDDAEYSVEVEEVEVQEEEQDVEVVEEGEEESSLEEDEADGSVVVNLTMAATIPYPSSPTPSPITLSQVCRHWRNVALSTPTLWATINVLPGGQPYKLESMMLERSKSVPIDVFVTGPCSDFDSALFSMLIPHIHRWRTMKILVWKFNTMDTFLRKLLDPSLPPASQLRTLKLSTNSTKESDPSYVPTMLDTVTLPAGSAPLLSTLVLWGIHADWDAPWITSAPILRDLQLGYHSEKFRPTWAQLFTILRGAPALEKLTLSTSGFSGDPDEFFKPTLRGPADPSARVQLSHLTHLDLNDLSQASVLVLLRGIDFPALVNLSLSLDTDDFTDLIHELAQHTTGGPLTSGTRQSILSRLTTLTLIDLPCHINSIETLYGELQHLKVFRLCVDNLPQRFDDMLIKPCMLPGRHGVWLPGLEELHLRGVTGGYYRKVVKKRREWGVPLRTLYLGEWDGVDSGDLKWLRKNVQKVRWWFA